MSSVDFPLRRDDLTDFISRSSSTSSAKASFDESADEELIELVLTIANPIKLEVYKIECFKYLFTGKSLSEAPLFAEHGEDKLGTEIVLNVKNNFLYTTRSELRIFMY